MRKAWNRGVLRLSRVCQVAWWCGRRSLRSLHNVVRVVAQLRIFRSIGRWECPLSRDDCRASSCVQTLYALTAPRNAFFTTDLLKPPPVLLSSQKISSTWTWFLKDAELSTVKLRNEFSLPLFNCNGDSVSLFSIRKYYQCICCSHRLGGAFSPKLMRIPQTPTENPFTSFWKHVFRNLWTCCVHIIVYVH